MSFFPTLNAGKTSRIVTDTFYGYNHRMKIADGEMFDEENLTSDFFPLLSTRNKRGEVAALGNPTALTAKNALAYIDGSTLYYNGYPVPDLVFSTDAEMLPKQIVSMGAYLVVFPDKKYYNTADANDYGSLEQTFSTIEDTDITYELCDVDGTEYDLTNTVISSAAPADPADGATWIDTSGSTHALKRFSETSAMWVQIPTVYVKIGYPNIGKNFEKGDGVTISGCSASGDMGTQISALNQTAVIYSAADDYIVIIGIIDSIYTQSEGSVTIKRQVPDMDYVVESNNRLWGCKFGMVGGNSLNEIYACKLGDFKNWNVFLGAANDSYVASLGTDGVFTGAITYQGYPLFFKEDYLHKVYISSTGAHQIEAIPLDGVQKGSALSLAIADNVLYYKGRTAVYAYDGAMPNAVSSALGDTFYYQAVGGAYGKKYYISMSTAVDDTGTWTQFVYDSSKGLWHAEDNLHVRFYAKNDDELYAIGSDDKLYALRGTAGTLEGPVEWSAETGIIGYEYPNSKYISRFNIRCKLDEGAIMDVYIEYDSSARWEHRGRIVGNSATRTYMLPISPRRCDHMRVKLSGKGDAKIYSIAKILEIGGDGHNV